MISRYYWSDSRSEPTLIPARSAASPRPAAGWLLVISLSGLLTLWLLYRWLVRPLWLAQLPGGLVEILDLVQTAGFLTLVAVWVGLLVRRRVAGRPRYGVSRALDELQDLSPKEFEHYVAGLFRRKGYRAVVRGRAGDHGVDLELRAPTGKRAIVQCKRYQNTVGEDVVRELFGTLIHERASRAFLVTTADISGSARDWAQGKPITLIDGRTLVRIAASLD